MICGRKRGIEIVRREIEAGYDEWTVCLEELFLVLSKVHGVYLPNEEDWRKAAEKDQRRRQNRARQFARMARHLAKMEDRERESDPVKSLSRRGTSGPQKTTRRKTRKVGRNEPCPCGSGEKYKKCCGKN